MIGLTIHMRLQVGIMFFVFFFCIHSILTYFLLNVQQDQFRDYLLLEAERREIRSIIENKSRIVLAHSTSGYK